MSNICKSCQFLIVSKRLLLVNFRLCQSKCTQRSLFFLGTLTKEIVMKAGYICGPLTELNAKKPGWWLRLWSWLWRGIWNILPEREMAKRLYERSGDACLEVMGVRAFVPH